MKPTQILAKPMPVNRFLPWARGLMALSLAAGAWALSTAASTAHAGSVQWSVGVHSPGVVVGVTNARPPIYVRPSRHVEVHRAPVVVYPGYRHARPAAIGPRHHGHRGSDRRHYRSEWEERREARREWREDRRMDRRDRRHAEKHHRRSDRHGHGHR